MKISILIFAVFTLTISAEDKDESIHLFILSGQSNMACLKPEWSFTPAVKNAFGEKAVVVKDAWSGQPIRKWYNLKKDPETNKPIGGHHLYDRLMKKVREEVKGRKLATVTFIWMQGETDGASKKGEAYEACLKGLLAEVKKDLGIEQLNYVIGRISDCDMENSKYLHWTMVRDIQVKVAESDPNGAWVDTDDLNDDKVHKGKLLKNPMHYSNNGYKILGQRFADKAIELIKKQ